MSSMKNLTATLPDGRVVKRKTQHAYTHVVAVLKLDETWGVLRWTATPSKIKSEAARFGYEVWRLVPVHSV